jgi:hypothetical protein
VDRIARGVSAALVLLALFHLLGAQGARLGLFNVPTVSPGWILAVLALLMWLTPSRGIALGPRLLLVGALFLVTFVFLTLWRSHALHSTTSIQIEGRNELRRLTGKRRDVSLQRRGVLEVPEDGVYAFEIYCDDACEITIGNDALRAEGALRRELALSRGDVPLEIRFRQNSGPARLAISWDGPRFFELLPLDFYLRPFEAAPPRRLEAHLSLAGLAIWWMVFPFYWMTLARAKDRMRQSALVPVAAAAFLVLYGGLLRYEALLAHSDLVSRNARAARIHEALLPWLPSYGVFNPENAPEDPYRADVRSYLDRAEAMGSEGFYAPSFREPFYVLLVAAFVRLAGGPFGILVESAVFSALTLVLFYFVGAKLHGRLWAVALLVPVVLHEWLVLDAPTGYRESAYSFFLLAFVAAFLFCRGAVLTGALGGLLCLVRLSALSIVAPLVAIRVYRLPPRERVRFTAALGATLLLLVGPFLYANFRAHGDPFYSVSFHTEFWLRAEGLAREEGPVSLSRYFTDFGRTAALAKGTLLGLTALPLRTFWNGFAHFPLLGAATLGLGAIGLVRGKNLYLTAAYFGHLVAFAYIQNFPSGEMPRFVMPAFLVLVLTVPYAVTLGSAVVLSSNHLDAQRAPRKRQ